MGRFTPPLGLQRHIRRALTWIDPIDLHGINHIFLFEDIPEVSKQGDPDVERAIRDNLLICGAYRALRATMAAHVILIVKSLYHPMPGIFVHTPAMTLSIARTIAHEVGHHLIAEKRFALRPKPGGASWKVKRSLRIVMRNSNGQNENATLIQIRKLAE